MSKSFEFEITKDEVIKLNNLLHSLALFSDLEDVQQANFTWTNIFNRNMFGYSIGSFDKYFNRILHVREIKRNCIKNRVV